MSWQKSLNQVLKTHNKYAQGGKAASFATQEKRRDTFELGFKHLRKLGYKLDSAQQFKERHMMALAQFWEAEGKSASTIQNRISDFRTLSGWIGKQGMIRDSHYYVKDPNSVKRSTVATVDKSWSGQGVDVAIKINQAMQLDKFVGIQLALMAAFGLRAKEAHLLKPHLADKGSYLAANWGTKGGRPRPIPIETPEQRQVLELAKQAVTNKTDSLVPQQYRYKQWRNHFYYVCREVNITRKDGITSHGLRHERLQIIYKNITGTESTVKNHQAQPNKELDQLARQEVAEVAGHSRAMHF